MPEFEMPFSDESPRLIPPVSERDHILGVDNAPLTLVEFGDYQCPYCGAAHEVVKELQENFRKKLRFVFRHFPLTQIHEYALLAAEAAEAAGFQGKFWPLHEVLYENQAWLGPESILKWAGDLGLNLEKLGKDIAEGRAMKRIKEDRLSGIRSGVNGTPTFFLNGLRHNGPFDYNSLSENLQDLLALKISY
jgi:protein-disulfide isomerase